MPSKTLFSPVQIGKHNLEHRVVMAPLTRNRATIDALPTDAFIEYYAQRASKGGLLISEATFIDPLAGGYKHVPGIYNQNQIENWKKVTSAVHKKGGVIFMQLWHIGRLGSKKLNPFGEQPVSASNIPAISKNVITGYESEIPHALTIPEIKEWVQKYKQAALNAIEAGFDGIEINAAYGYFIDQFINSNSNNRIDEYGGSADNRARLALEIISAVSKAIGAERTAIRLSPGSSFQDMADATPVETWSCLVAKIQQEHPKLAYVHLVQARADITIDKFITGDSIEPYRKIWKGQVIAAGGYSSDPNKALDYAQENNCLVAFGRHFISNPDLPLRLCKNLPLNPYDRSTFYSNGLNGYIDYPMYTA